MRAVDVTRRCASCRRRGAALYLTTVSISIVAAGVAWTLLATQRADRRLQSNIDVENQAWWGARAGVEIGLAYAEQVPLWRIQSTTVLSNVAVGNTRCTIQILDDRDASLGNNECDPARLLVTATCSGASRKLQAALMPRPHAALKYCCFGTTADDMEFKGTARVYSPVRSHGKIRGAAGVTSSADASYETMSGYTIESPLAPKYYTTTAISPPSVNLSWYLAQATPITGTSGATCKLQGYNLTPTSNPTGTLNANGVYSLDAGGRDVLIENLHLRGTLIIYNAPSRTITFQKGLWIEPGPMGYPVLLLDNPSNDTAIDPDASLTELTSSLVVLNLLGINITLATSVDFNEDGDVLDVFTTSVRGLVWASSRSLTLKRGSWSFVGTLINPHVIVDNNVAVSTDVQLQNTLCPGFVGTTLRLQLTSFKDAP